jgi:XRE family transcriptional regulator, aerobic/anaerobic benzoate catabolism transcriptional regulator
MDEQALLIELGRRLRAARERRSKTVSDLAREAGLSRRYLTDAEAGRANLSLVKLFALCRPLGLRARDLLDLDPPRLGRIALVGLRGAGKTTIGRKLALRLEAPFVELDQRVEELAGLSLAAIFELHGAAAFRRLEAEALEKVLSEGERVVLATGGSIVSSEPVFERLLATCRTVWLKARPEDHYARVLAQGDQRPMRGRPRPLEELTALLAAREPQYARCEVVVDTSATPVEAAVESLARAFAA